jgi:hypothetical protein
LFPLLLVLLIAAILFGVGVAIHMLWFVAAVVLVLWLLGFLIRPRSEARWYYW